MHSSSLGYVLFNIWNFVFGSIQFSIVGLGPKLSAIPNTTDTNVSVSFFTLRFMT